MEAVSLFPYSGSEENSLRANQWPFQISAELSTAARDSAEPVHVAKPLARLPMVEAALYHARNGWAVFPLAPGGKVPLYGSQGYRDATKDEVLIREMWAREPMANIGGVPGMSGRVVVDIDPRHGGDVSFEGLVETYGPAFQLTPTTLTGSGGVHICFDSIGLELASTKVALGQGIEVFASTGYVVLPYSIHPNGNVYEYEQDYSPEDCEYRPVPDWLVELLRHHTHVRGRTLPDVRTREIPGILREEGGLRGELLAATAGDRDFVLSVCQLLRIPNQRLGSSFRCILPGHQEHSPSASIYKNSEGYYTYHDFHFASKDSSEYYTLAEVAHARYTGRLRHLKAPELATWHLRLLVETGHVEPAQVHMPPLPVGSHPTVERVYNGFRFLLQCKWLYNPDQPTAFARDFAAEWCGGITERQAYWAITKLIQAGKIVPVSKYGLTREFLPQGYV